MKRTSRKASITENPCINAKQWKRWKKTITRKGRFDFITNICIFLLFSAFVSLLVIIICAI
jgi:hypothetical protein